MQHATKGCAAADQSIRCANAWGCESARAARFAGTESSYGVTRTRERSQGGGRAVCGGALRAVDASGITRAFASGYFLAAVTSGLISEGSGAGWLPSWPHSRVSPQSRCPSVSGERRCGGLSFQSEGSGCTGDGGLTPHLDGSVNVYDVVPTISGCQPPYDYLNAKFSGLAPTSPSSAWDDDVLLRMWLSQITPDIWDTVPPALTMSGRLLAGS